MRRREFITLFGGVVTLPLTAKAQRTLPVIGFLHEGLPAPAHLTAAFRLGLVEAGVSENGITIENRWAEGQYDRLPALAADLVEHRAEVIAAAYLVAARAAKAVTDKVPIVFVTGSDPVAANLVSSLNRPTGNITGVAFMFTRLGPKNLEILHEIAPKATVVGVLLNPNNPNAEPQLRDLQASAPLLNLRLIPLAAGSVREIEGIFATLQERQIDAMLVSADGFFFGLQDVLIPLAARYTVPTVFPLSDYVVAGGLVSYGANLSESWRQTGIYVGKIVRGMKTTNLPIEQSAKFELVINLKTAKALKLEISPKLLALVDKVIE